MSWTDKARISAAAQAIREIRNNTTIGLGSGNTVLRALELAAERVKKENLKITFIPTSYQTEIAAKIRKISEKTVLREAAGKVGPVITDNGNLIADVYFRSLRRPEIVHEKLKKIPGVVETGLFLGMCDVAYVGRKDGRVDILRKG